MGEKQFVVFKLGKEEYGIDIMNVKEIGPFQESVKVPNSPTFVEGIINYRGNVIPIVCLKKRFNLPVNEVDKNTRIIVINLKDKQIGFLVDEASQTIRLEDKAIDSPPDIVGGIDKRYITGVGKIEDRLIILIDLEKVLNEGEKQQILEMTIE